MTNAPISSDRSKTASRIIIYLIEELGDARLRAAQLKRYIDQATELIEKSEHRDHFYEVAAHLLQGIPEALFKLEKALDASAMAAARMDYEEIKQGLKPEKAEELEDVMEDTRLRYLKRRSDKDSDSDEEPMTPKDAALALRHIASQTRAMGRVPVTPLLNLIASLETADPVARNKTAAIQNAAETFEAAATYLGGERPSRRRVAASLRRILADTLQPTASALAASLLAQASSREEVMEGFKAANPGLTEAQLKEIADQWEANKDVVKDKSASENEDKQSRFEQGKPADPTENMSEEQKAEWEKQNKEHRDKFKSAAEGDKESRFEEGKPADPTENMSEEDAAKWKEEHDKNKDKFKTAAEGQTVTLNSGDEVLAKKYKGELTAVTYANRSQADAAAEKMGEGWEVIQRGRPWYLRKVKGTKTAAEMTSHYAFGLAASKLQMAVDAFSYAEDADGYARGWSNLSKGLGVLKEFFEGLLPLASKELGEAAIQCRGENTNVSLGGWQTLQKAQRELSEASDAARSGNIPVSIKSLSQSIAWLAEVTAGAGLNMTTKALMNARAIFKRHDKSPFETKTAADEPKESRFEEGKPADPTENMSEEDAAKWKEEHDKNKDKFKTAGGQDKELSNVKKRVAPHMWVISKDPTGSFLVTIGDPEKPSSKIKARLPNKSEVVYWVRDNVGDTVSQDHVVDITGLRLVPEFYTQWFVDNMM